MANKPHIMMGPGKPVSIGDLPVRDQLNMYLRRLRRTLTFPTTPEDAYFGCMPSVVKKLFDEGAFEPAAVKPSRVANFLNCLTSATDQASVTGRSIKSNVLHVGDETDVFWFITPENVPIPVYRLGTPFELPLDHPQHEAITKWVAQALKIEDGIQRVFATIAKLEIHAKSGAEIASAWPELLSFVRYKRIMPQLPAGSARKLRAKVDEAIGDIERRNALEILSTCVMLPERSLPLQGWVNYYVEGL